MQNYVVIHKISCYQATFIVLFFAIAAAAMHLRITKSKYPKYTAFNYFLSYEKQSLANILEASL